MKIITHITAIFVLIASLMMCSCGDVDLGSVSTNLESGTEQVATDVEPEVEASLEEETVIDDSIDIPVSEEDCIGMTYTDLEKTFKNAGFTNIILKSTEFDSSSSHTKDNVVSISINGAHKFVKGDKYAKDAYIEIEYAIIKEETKASVEKETASSASAVENDNSNTASSSDKQAKEEENKVPSYNIAEMSAIMYVTQTVNVRKIPDLNGEKLGSLNLNDEVTVTGKVDNGWYRIKYGDAEAYVKEGFFSEQKVQNAATPPIVVSPSDDNGATNNSGSGASVTVPTQADTEGDLVWVPTKGGKKYHSKPGCSGMEDPIQVTREHAEANGFTPCKKCH